MFVSIKFSDGSADIILRDQTEESLKKKLEDLKGTYRMIEKNRIKNRRGGIKAIFYKAIKRPKYIWQ